MNMATILRGSRFFAVKRILQCLHRTEPLTSNVVRCVNRTCIDTSKIPLFLARHLTTGTSAVPQRRDVEAVEGSSQSSVNQHLQILDSQVRQWGRVDREEVEQVLKLLHKTGKVTDQQSLMLLRCPGSLMVKVNPKDRTKIFQDIWEQLQSLGAVYNVSHYNAALNVHLRNGHQFSPTEFLAEMEEKEIIPNRLTYQLLIAKYCEDGDIEGASKILEYMKSSGMAVNESVFSAMIRGHMKKGDTEGAYGILGSMREAGLEPSSETYTEFLHGFAEKGDQDGIQKVLEEVQREEVVIKAYHLLAVVGTLARHGHDSLVTQILEQVPQMGYNHDKLNCAFQLVAQGHDDVAYQVFLSINHARDALGVAGRMFLRNMVMNGRPLSKIQEIQENLAKMESLEEDSSLLAIWALKFHQPDMALTLFQKMKEENRPVRCHYYWPVLNQYAEKNNTDGIFQAVQQMVSLAEDKALSLVPTLATHIVELLGQQDINTVMDRLKDAGCNERITTGLKVIHLAGKGQLAEAVELGTSTADFMIHVISYILVAAASPVALSLTTTKNAVLQGYIQSRDWDNAIKLMKIAEVKQKLNMGEACGQLLRQVLRYGEDAVQLEPVVDAIIQQKMWLPASQCKQLVNICQTKEFPAEIIQKLESLKQSTGTPPGGAEKDAFQDKSTEELEKLLEERKAVGGPNLKGLYKNLLFKYCQEGNVEKAESVKAILDSQGFVYSAEMLRQLALLAAQHKKDLAEALHFKQLLESQYPNFQLYLGLVLQVATQQAENKQVEEAIKTLKDYASTHKEFLAGEGLSEGYQMLNLASTLLKACRAAGDPAATREVMDTLFECGYVKDGAYQLLETCVIGYIESDDMEGLVDMVNHCVEKYTRLPAFNSVFRTLIEKEDSERLQKVVDHASQLFGEMNTLLNVASTFIDCGKTKQARKLLQTPGLRAVMPVLTRTAEVFVNRNRVKPLEDLVDLTRDLFAIDRDEMLFQLMRMYAKNKDVDKALDIYTRFQEEGVMPKPRTLRYLAKVLENSGKEVPFEVPSVTQWPVAGMELVASNSVEKEAVEAIQAQDIDKFLTIRQRAEEEGSALRPELVSDLIGYINKKGSIAVLKNLIYRLGELGDAQSLLLSRKHRFSSNLQKYVSQRIFSAYINGNRAEEILDYLAENPQTLNSHSSSRGIMDLAEKNPELIPRFEELVQKSGNRVTFSHMFNYYMLSEQFDKARAFLQNHPELQPSLQVKFICDASRNQDKLHIIQELMAMAREQANNGRLAYLYDQVLHHRCDQEDWQECLACLDQMGADGLTHADLASSAISRVEALFLQHNQSLPWQPGTIKGRTRSPAKRKDSTTLQSESDSDSSSSSDSDTEQTAKS